MYNQQQNSVNPRSISVKSESGNGSPNIPQNSLETSSNNSFIEAHSNSNNQSMLEGLRKIAEKYKDIRRMYNGFKENSISNKLFEQLEFIQYNSFK